VTGFSLIGHLPLLFLFCYCELARLCTLLVLRLCLGYTGVLSLSFLICKMGWYLEWLQISWGEGAETLPVPALDQALFAQLEPARSAGKALHAVSSFTGPARDVAGHTPVAVLISVVALWAVFHAGRVCKRGEESDLTANPTCGSHTSPVWEEGDCISNESPVS
jgi:hypothetical protein